MQTDAGPVALAPVAAVESRADDLRRRAATLQQHADDLRRQAEEAFISAGSAVLPKVGEWTPPNNLQGVVQQAVELSRRYWDDAKRDDTLKTSEASMGFLARIGAHHQEHELEHEEREAAEKIRPLLAQIGRGAIATQIAEAETSRQQGADLEGRAADVDKDAQAATDQAAELDAQAKRRHDAIKQMGFDSLYEAAVLQTSGPAPVEAPLVLKAGERAYVSVPATLARMGTRTKYVGGSSGFSIPIGHTGIRYRVGSFHGQPVQQQFLRHLDSGTLVITNQRLAYVGATKAVTTPLAKILSVETYNDGLSVAREGRENPDFFLTDAARHVVFLLNWFLGHQAAG